MKKNGFKLLMVILAVVSLVVCSNDNDESPQDASIAGEWSGTLTGAFTGTWNATIDNEGNLEGEINVDTRTIPLDFSGIQTDFGQFIGSALDEEGFSLSLNGDFVGNTIVGFYTFGGKEIAGDWEGTRN